jgi:membrane protein DedA with SNARE-associated domain
MEQFERYGYPALALLVLLEGIGIPTPAVSVVVAAAALAAHGELSLPVVAIVTLLAAVAGDNLGYLAGRRFGRPLLERFGQRLEKAERFVRTRGRNIVLVARFIDGLRQTNGLLCGATGMPWRAYATRDAIGGVLWSALWVTVGAVFGGHVEQLWRYRWWALAVVAVLLGGYLAYRARRRRQAD